MGGRCGLRLDIVEKCVLLSEKSLKDVENVGITGCIRVFCVVLRWFCGVDLGAERGFLGAGR